MTPRINPEEARKLLGGYATGTLTDAEREALFAAALEDQSLFDALAEEDALRELLEAPGAKTRLLAAVQETPSANWFGIPALTRPAAPSAQQAKARPVPAVHQPTKARWFGIGWLTSPRVLSFGGLAAIAALTVAFLAQKPVLLPQKPEPVSEIAQAPPINRVPEPTASAPTMAAPRPGSVPAQKKSIAAPAPAEPAVKKTFADEKARVSSEREASREPAKEAKERDAAARRDGRVSEARKEETPGAATPPARPPVSPAPARSQPPPPPVVDVPSPTPAPKVADVQSKGPAPVASESANQGFRPQAPAQVQQQIRPAPSQQTHTPATMAAPPAPEAVKRKQDENSLRGAGGKPEPAADQRAADKSQDKVASARDRRGALSGLARQNVAPAPPSLTLRYRLVRPEGGDAPTELTVETSIGFVYVLRRTGSGWDTVASGNGPHTISDNGEFAIVASRTELPNPAVALVSRPDNRDIASQSGDGFTTIVTRESSVATRLRIRGR